MRDEPRRPLQREGVRFFGAMGAGLSHELSNVFNIINELSGLQQDIVSASAEGSAGLGRVADLAARIRSQAARGEEINRSLHRLSHSVDEAETSFDVGQLLGLFGALGARSARLAEVGLEIRPPVEPVSFRGDPFALLLALYACLQQALAAAAEARRIEVTADAGDDRVRVVLVSADALVGDAGTWEPAAMLELACAALPAALIRQREPGGGDRIMLELGAAAASVATVDGEREA